MKRFFLCLFIALMPALASAQEDAAPQHMLFEGLSIDGDVNPFVRALTHKGFKQVKQDAILTGKVFGHKGTVIVASRPDDNIVYLVMVNYDTKKSWENVRTCYESIKMQLSLRYGDPAISREEFASELAEANPLLALEHGNCTYVSHYSVPGGEILLSINREATVQLFFIDTVNSQPMRPQLQSSDN